jgi:hypothetical protein
LSKKFLFAIYYTLAVDIVQIKAVVDLEGIRPGFGRTSKSALVKTLERVLNHGS